MASESKRVFQAYEAISKRYAQIPQKLRLDLSYKWNTLRKDSTEPFICKEFWGFVEDYTLNEAKKEIDFLEDLNAQVTDFLIAEEICDFLEVDLLLDDFIVYDAVDKDGHKGRWITINADKDKDKDDEGKGTHIFIRSGESVGQAIERKYGSGKKKLSQEERFKKSQEKVRARKEVEKEKEKPLAQGKYSQEQIIGKLSDLSALRQKYKDELSLKAYVDKLIELYERLEEAQEKGNINEIDKLEKGIENTTSFFREKEAKIIKKENERKEEIQFFLKKFDEKKAQERLEGIKEQAKSLNNPMLNMEISTVQGAIRELFRLQDPENIPGQIRYIEKLFKEVERGIEHLKPKEFTEKDWAKQDAKASEEIKELNKRRDQSWDSAINNYQSRIDAGISTIDWLEEKIPQSMPNSANRDSLERQLKENQTNLKKNKNILKNTNAIKELKLPFQFNVREDSTLKVWGKSKEAEHNKVFLERIRGSYNLLPARFRGKDAVKVDFYVNCGSHPINQRRSIFGGTKNTRSKAGGQYYEAKGGAIKGIIIPYGKKLRDRYSPENVINHEKGHEVHYKLAQERPAIWDKFVDLFNKNRVKMITDVKGALYASKNAHEAFASTFAEYTSGKADTEKVYWNVTGNVKNPNSHGIIDDLPEFKEYFQKYFGQKGFARGFN